MKKTYIVPSLEAVIIQTQGMLAASVQVNDTTFSGTKNDVLGHESNGDWDD